MEHPLSIVDSIIPVVGGHRRHQYLDGHGVGGARRNQSRTGPQCRSHADEANLPVAPNWVGGNARASGADYLLMDSEGRETRRPG